MESIKNNILKVNYESVLLFDLDGTLINTDLANFLSYAKAIKSVVNLDKGIQYNPYERFNRTTLKKAIPNLTDFQYNNIIEQKEKNYKEHLPHTQLNKSVAGVLAKYYKTNKTVLVTNCREDRAMLTLNYHNLTDKFDFKFFRNSSDNKERANKYTNVISSLNLSVQTVIVFENEIQEIKDAIFAGVPINNIINFRI